MGTLRLLLCSCAAFGFLWVPQVSAASAEECAQQGKMTTAFVAMKYAGASWQAGFDLIDSQSPAPSKEQAEMHRALAGIAWAAPEFGYPTTMTPQQAGEHVRNRCLELSRR